MNAEPSPTSTYSPRRGYQSASKLSAVAVLANSDPSGDAFDRAAKAIGLAMVFDSLDGRVARLTGTNTEFGVQFDSLADIVSFGVAPAFLAYAWGIRAAAAANAPEALPVRVTQAQDIGMYWLVTGSVGSGADERVVRARVSPQQAIPRVGDTAWFGVVGPHTCFYRGDELIEEATR